MKATFLSVGANMDLGSSGMPSKMKAGTNMLSKKKLRPAGAGSARHGRDRKFMDYLKKLEEQPENFQIMAVQPKSMRKFFK